MPTSGRQDTVLANSIRTTQDGEGAVFQWLPTTDASYYPLSKIICPLGTGLSQSCWAFSTLSCPTSLIHALWGSRHDPEFSQIHWLQSPNLQMQTIQSLGSLKETRTCTFQNTIIRKQGLSTLPISKLSPEII